MLGITLERVYAPFDSVRNRYSDGDRIRVSILKRTFLLDKVRRMPSRLLQVIRPLQLAVVSRSNDAETCPVEGDGFCELLLEGRTLPWKKND